MKRAIIIDEEPNFSETVARALSLIGFEVTQCFDATSALAIIHNDTDQAGTSLLFIDMALEPGSDHATFNATMTENYMTTGLVLASIIVREGVVAKEKRKNMILYSAHMKGQNWAKINSFCEKNGTRKWQKKVDAELMEIIALAKEFIE